MRALERELLKGTHGEQSHDRSKRWVTVSQGHWWDQAQLLLEAKLGPHRRAQHGLIRPG